MEVMERGSIEEFYVCDETRAPMPAEDDADGKG